MIGEDEVFCFVFLCVYLLMWGGVCMPCACKGQKKVSDLLEMVGVTGSCDPSSEGSEEQIWTLWKSSQHS